MRDRAGQLAYVMRGGLCLIFWFAAVERINLNWRLGALISAVR
jgi:hypothetical protein